MKKILIFIISSIMLSSCITLPVPDPDHVSKCEISSDRLTLKIVDIADSTNTYYTISGVILSPILVPGSAIISGAYVLANNIYVLGEEKIKCGNTLSNSPSYLNEK